jgi:hypothetical protein
MAGGAGILTNMVINKATYMSFPLDWNPSFKPKIQKDAGQAGMTEMGL